jgi:hypothetical protein
MPNAILAATGTDRQPPRAPGPRVVSHLSDDTIRLLAKSIHVARWLNVVERPAPFYEALSVDEQRALEREAMRVIRQGDMLACAVALHRAAQSIGVTPERLAEALACFDAHLEGV